MKFDLYLPNRRLTVFSLIKLNANIDIMPLAWYYRSMKKIAQKILITKRPYSEAQKKQDEIFRKMSADKKVKLCAEFSQFVMKLHKLGDKHAI